MANLYENSTSAFADSDAEWTVGVSDINTVLIGQIFNVGLVGKNEKFNLSSIKLGLAKNGTPTGDLTVEIWSVTSYTTSTMVLNEKLCSGSIAFADIGAVGWYLCNNFTGNTVLEASTSYAIVLNHMETLTAANYLTIYSGSYGGGQRLAYYSIDGGVIWKEQMYDDFPGGTEDLAFQIYGTTYTTGSASYDNYNNTIAKAGAGADTTSKSLANISLYVQSAESVLNVRTKKNWTDAYAALNEDVKYIVDEIISSLAAIKVINYNMAGYTSRLEAEGMKLTLMNEAEKYIAELKDVDIQKWMAAVT
jgi:hypothetical protein